MCLGPSKALGKRGGMDMVERLMDMVGEERIWWDIMVGNEYGWGENEYGGVKVDMLSGN